jgi:HSP20 family protein
MAIVRWNPWREMEDLFDSEQGQTGRPKAGNRELATTGDWVPRVDISETDNEFVITAEIPDVKKKDVSVTVENGVLAIRGERKQETEEHGKKFHRIERHYGSFTRSFTLPDNVDQTKIKASFKNGMLNLKIEKTEAVKPKTIEINVE